LRDLGVGKGDAVGVHLPMMPETVAVTLALARIGAVAVPLFTGYGPAAMAERLTDVGAVCIFTANAFPQDSARCSLAGMNDYLSKPLEVVAFEAVLSRYLQTRKEKFPERNSALASP